MQQAGARAARTVTSASTYRRTPAKLHSTNRADSSTTSLVAGSIGSDVTHGTRSGYNSGCRCPECTEANTAASRARRERLAGRSTANRRKRPALNPTMQVTGLVSPRALPRPRSQDATPISWTRALGGPLGLPSAQPPRPLFGKGKPGRSGDHQRPDQEDWDSHARLLRLYLAGAGPSPSLLALTAESKACKVVRGEAARP
jgi:hypothetical protein